MEPLSAASFIAAVLSPVFAGWVRYLFDWGQWVFAALLVVVGFLQVWLLRVTWDTIQRQTQLLRFSQQQWLDIGNWTIEGDSTPSDDSRLACTFELSNHTSLPVTLTRVTTDVLLMGSRTRPRSYEVTEFLMLPPHSPSSRYVVRVPVLMDDQQLKRFRKGELFVHFEGTIAFLGPDGSDVPQRFQQLTNLMPGKITLWRPHGAIPEEVPCKRPICPETDNDSDTELNQQTGQ